MAILDILEAPHPVLSQRARPVRDDELGPELAAHMEDMAETMYAAPGVGLAAPQVGDSRQVLVADPGFEGEDGEQRKGVELVYMVNPVITERSRDTITWSEACLSVPEYEQNVKRSRKITVAWRGPDGTEHERIFEDFAAVVIQHEMDHLAGKTLLDHSSRLKRGRYMKKQRKRAAKS